MLSALELFSIGSLRILSGSLFVLVIHRLRHVSGFPVPVWPRCIGGWVVRLGINGPARSYWSACRVSNGVSARPAK